MAGKRISYVATGHQREIEARLTFIFWLGEMKREGFNSVFNFRNGNVECKLGIQNDMEIKLHSLLHDNVHFHTWVQSFLSFSVFEMPFNPTNGHVKSGSSSPFENVVEPISWLEARVFFSFHLQPRTNWRAFIYEMC